MSEQRVQLRVDLIDNATAGITKIQKALKSFAFENVERFAKVFTSSSFIGGVERVSASFKSMSSNVLSANSTLDKLSVSMQGFNEWSQKTVEIQTEIQKSLGLLTTKITDETLQEFADSLNLKLDISDPETKIKLFNQYLRSVKKEAQNWSIGIGDFAKIAPMSFQNYIDQMKQLQSSGLTGLESTLAIRHAAVLSKALETSHIDAAYDMARVFNTIKATTKDGLIDKEATFKQIASLFDYMDNVYQFKFGKNAIAQLKKTMAVGLSRGFSLEELGVAAGNISSSGLEGGMGDTALKEFISRLSIAEEKAAKAGLAFSYHFGQSLPDIIRNLNKATAGLDDKSRVEFFRDAFGERGVQAVERFINCADKMQNEIQQAKKAIDGYGNAFRSAFSRSQDFATSQEILSYQIDYFNGRVGIYTAGIRWMFTDLSTSCIAFLANFQNSHTSIKAFIGNTISSFLTLGGVVTAFGTDLISLAMTPLYFLGNFGLAMTGMSQLMPYLKNVGKAFINFAKGMAVIGVGAVKSLGFSLLWLAKVSMVSTLNAFKVLRIGILNLIKTMVSLTIITLQAIFSQQFWTKTLWQAIAAGARNIFILTLMGISYALIGVKTAIASAVSAGFWLVTTIGAWLAMAPLSMITAIFLAIVASIALMGTAIYLFWKNWDSVWGWIKDSFSGAINFISEGFRWLWNFADKITFGFLGKLWNGLKFVFGWLWDKMKQLGKWLGYYFEGDKTLSIAGESALTEGLSGAFSNESYAYGRGAGSQGRDFVLPEGAYAYQIDKRMGNISTAKTAIAAGTMSKAAIAIDTEKDILRDIRNILKEIRDKNMNKNRIKSENNSKPLVVIKKAEFSGVSDLESAVSIINEFAEAVTLTSE